MPSSKDAPPPEPATAVKEAPAEPGASPSPEPPETAPGMLPAGVYEYTAPFATVYGLPLTARPENPGRPAQGDDPGEPAVPATVFAWDFGCPDDGRWKPTKKKPNQVADNAAPLGGE